MNHLERMISMFNESNVEFTSKSFDEIVKTNKTELKEATDSNGRTFQIEWPITKTVRRTIIRIEEGYNGFYTILTFNEYGDLMSVKAFE